MMSERIVITTPVGTRVELDRSGRRARLSVRAAPWDTTATTGDGRRIQIARQALSADPAADLRWRHAERIGALLDLDDRDDGLYASAELDTVTGADLVASAGDRARRVGQFRGRNRRGHRRRDHPLHGRPPHRAVPDP